MPIRPSIVLEGASRAADWIPFAQNMLRGMASDGTSNFSPEDGITIVIFRHGSVAKISIHATYPTGFKFVGVPYTSVNTSGWGSPYDEDNPKGTPGAGYNRDVILEKDKGVWTVKRYPRYKTKYPDLEYGNMDWTSSDGKTVLSWYGPNSGPSCEMQYHRQTLGITCEENLPANNWHKGYLYPGQIEILSFDNSMVVYIPQRITAVDDRESTTFAGELFIGHNIYMNGEILATINAAGDYNYEADGGEGESLFVYGAAIQKVTEADDTITSYLVAMLCDYSIVVGATTSYRYKKHYLYRAPMDDLDDFELTEVFTSGLGGGDGTDSPWTFNSTGTKVVGQVGKGAGVQAKNASVYEISITDDGSVTYEMLWDADNKSKIGTAKRYDYKSPLDPGEFDDWDATNTCVLAVSYKDDAVRYAVVYSEYGGRVGYDRDTSGACDIDNRYTTGFMNSWFAFADNPADIKSDSPVMHRRKEYFSELTYGGVDPGSSSDPAVKRITGMDEDYKIPIYIDCRHDTVLFHNTKEPQNEFSYGFAVGFTSFMMPELNNPPTYQWTMNLELQIEGIVAYESSSYTQTRTPGDCFKNSIYSLSSGKPCDLTGFQLSVSSIPPDDSISITQQPVTFPGFETESFCNIQIHKTNPTKPDFDILFTARTKFSDIDAPSDSFIAHWDGEALIDRQDISTLLDIDDDGVLANTGKI